MRLECRDTHMHEVGWPREWGTGHGGQGVTTADAHHRLVSVRDAHRLLARHCGVRGGRSVEARCRRSEWR